jgi:hypothetical protein
MAKDTRSAVKALDDINHLAHNHGKIFEWFQDAEVITKRPSRENKADPTGTYHYQWVSDIIYDKAMKDSFDYMIPFMSKEGKEWFYKYCLWNHETHLMANPSKYLSHNRIEALKKEAEEYMRGRKSDPSTKGYMDRWIDQKRQENEVIEKLLSITDDKATEEARKYIAQLSPFVFQFISKENEFLFRTFWEFRKKTLGVERFTEREDKLINRIATFFRNRKMPNMSKFISSLKPEDFQ